VYGWGRLVATHRGRPGGEDGGNLMPRSPRSRVSESQAAARRSAEEDYILYADYAARSTTSSMQTMPRGVLHTLSRLCRDESTKTVCRTCMNTLVGLQTAGNVTRWMQVEGGRRYNDATRRLKHPLSSGAVSSTQRCHVLPLGHSWEL
jgi:hypothetical protein